MLRSFGFTEHAVDSIHESSIRETPVSISIHLEEELSERILILLRPDFIRCLWL